MDKDTARTLNGAAWAALVLCVALGIADNPYVWAAFAIACVVFVLFRTMNPASKAADQFPKTKDALSHEATANSRIVTDSRLLGIWKLERGDVSTACNIPEVRLHFFPTGEMTYSCKLDTDVFTKRMTYTINGDTVVVHDPAMPAEEQSLSASDTSYSFREDGTLAGKGGLMVQYRRVTSAQS